MTRTELKAQILAVIDPVLISTGAKLGADAITPPPKTGQIEVRLYVLGDEYRQDQPQLRSTQFALTLAGWIQDPISDVQEQIVQALQTARPDVNIMASEVDFKFVLPNAPDRIYIFEQLTFSLPRIV